MTDVPLTHLKLSCVKLVSKNKITYIDLLILHEIEMKYQIKKQ